MAASKAARAAVYIRVSSVAQADGTSLGTQEADCRAFARAQGYAVAEEHIYRDTISAEDLYSRPDALALLDSARAGRFDAVIFYKFDRVTRDQIDWGVIADACRRGGATIFSATEGEFDATPMGKFLTSAQILAAELELAKIKERTTRGKRARVESGRLFNNRAATYGYRFNADRTAYEINDETAPILRRIFREYDEGTPLATIAQRLNDEGIPTSRGARQWDRSVLLNMIQNTTYIGKHYAYKTKTTKRGGRPHNAARPAEEWIEQPNVAPPLIAVELFDRVQARREAARHHRPGVPKDPDRYILRGGLVYCGHCGWRLAVNDRRRGYHCSHQRRSDADCPYHRHDAAKLDALVWRRLVNTLCQREKLTEALRGREEGEAHADRLPEIAREIATIERKRRNLAAAIEQAGDDDDIADLLDRRKALGARLRALEGERDAATAEADDRARRRDETAAALAGWQRLADELSRRGADLFSLPAAQKRLWLERLHVRVDAYRPDPQPRYEITADIPLLPAVDLLPGLTIELLALPVGGETPFARFGGPLIERAALQHSQGIRTTTSGPRTPLRSS